MLISDDALENYRLHCIGGLSTCRCCCADAGKYVFLSAVFGEIRGNNHPKDVSKPDGLKNAKRWEMFVCQPSVSLVQRVEF